MHGTLDLLEREEELSALDAALGRARAGQGQVVAVEGPGGIGKTRLLAAARSTGRDAGMRVLHARASELERSFTFGVVRQLFEPALFTAQPAERDRWMSGAAGLTRSMFEDAGGGQDESSYARLHGLYWLCANLAADDPLLVCVDDAQWADEPSLSFLGFLARRIEDLPVALVLGTRPRPEQDSEVLRGLVTDPGTRLLRPPALTGAAVGQWVRSAVDPGAGAKFCAACHETTGGNPFLVRELLHEVLDKQLRATDAEAATVRELGPEAISTVVLQRLHRLPPTAPAMARAVALLGEGANAALAAELAGFDEPTAEEALEALTRGDVLTRDGDVLAFVHPIVLSAIYHDLPVRARSEGHGRAARLLHARGAAPEEVASQLALTAPRGDEWVVAALRAAAARALSLGDPAAAAAHLERALAEPPRDVAPGGAEHAPGEPPADVAAGGAEDAPDDVAPGGAEHAPGEPPADVATVTAELAWAEASAGAPRAVEHFRTAMRLAKDPRERGRMALGLARCLKFGGESPVALDVLRTALADLGDADPALAEQLQVELTASAYISLAARPLLKAEIAAITIPDVARTALDRVHLAASAFETIIAARPAERSAELARRALADDQLPMDLAAGGHTFLNAVTALMFSEAYDDAQQQYSRALDETRRRGSSVGFAAISSLRSLLLYRLGSLSGALADATAALDLRNDVHGAQGYLACALNSVVFASLDRGTAGPDLLALADDFFATQPSEDLPYSQAMHARGWLRADLGDREGGLAELLACGARELEWGVGTPQIIAWRSSAAEVCLRLGRLEQARGLAAEELLLARSIGAPRAIGVALRAAGLAESGARRIELLREAVTSLKASQGALELARARVDLGAALVRAGQRDEARGLLRDGQEGAAVCGATPLVERAHRELLATGARPRRTATAGRDGLTPSELRVTEMAAAGQTNREIAQALFVTEKTVETHLGRAFMKLGVRSRKQLAQALDRETAEVV
ncbi:helix-turn-helix transcriptional regulator [Solirubrobacter soli]|uniref:helix-turn-helix transcriptional regulator n=1 Tax=Solirubrobacter soli TaxID=363832 RepID=UPI0004033175|nr:LuxR family transcriptional regulator [Solirubrobacter soli]